MTAGDESVKSLYHGSRGRSPLAGPIPNRTARPSSRTPATGICASVISHDKTAGHSRHHTWTPAVPTYQLCSLCALIFDTATIRGQKLANTK